MSQLSFIQVEGNLKKMNNKQEIVKKVAKLASVQPWHHNYLLPENIQTRPDLSKTLAGNIGKWERLSIILGHINLLNKKVLDIGCSDGYYSMKIAEAKAKQVIGIDINDKRIEKALFIKSLLGLNNVDFYADTIDVINQKSHGKYDLILCLGFLHRYHNPYELLQILGAKTEMLLLEWKLPKHSKFCTASMELAIDNRYGIDENNISYFFPTFKFVETMLTNNGFSHFYRMEANHKRVVLLASKTPVFGLTKYKYVCKLIVFPKIFYLTKNYLKSIINVITHND